MKEELPDEVARDSDDGVAQSSGNKSDSPIPQDSQSFTNERVRSQTTNEDTAEQPLRGRKTSGPRTPGGKQRSKRNALKHGIFSKSAFLRGESGLELILLLDGLRNNLRPKGALEEILVDKLASILWRHRRMLIAEGAEIQRGTEFHSWYKSERDEREAEIFLRSEGKVTVGLFSRIENPVIQERCKEILLLFKGALVGRGFNFSADTRVLNVLFGDAEMKVPTVPLVYSYRLCSEQVEYSNLEELNKQKKARKLLEAHATPEGRKATFLKVLQDVIDRLDRHPEQVASIDAPREKLESLCRNVPDAPELDRLLRYEASLERSFDRTLSQLERLQRMRLGQPVLPKLEVRHSLS